MRLYIPYFAQINNMLVYSYLYYCEQNDIKFDLQFDSTISNKGGFLEVDGKTIFFDYSDNPLFADDPKKYSYYFKRSLRVVDAKENVYPLNFQVNYSYKSLSFLSQLTFKQLLTKSNRIEIIRALDYFNSFTNSSHNAKDIRKFPKQIINNGGKILFYTRLWNPDHNPEEDEKERRRLQNEFRIATCRIIKKNFKNASVGLFPDELAKRMAPDILLQVAQTSKKAYFGMLHQHDIGIADDGLKDTPGWKIGEYLLFGKAVVSTPFTVSIDNFKEHINYEKLTTRSSFEEVPEKIEYLLTGNKYLEVGKNNYEWSYNYLHPKNYIQRILTLTHDVLK